MAVKKEGFYLAASVFKASVNRLKMCLLKQKTTAGRCMDNSGAADCCWLGAHKRLPGFPRWSPVSTDSPSAHVVIKHTGLPATQRV